MNRRGFLAGLLALPTLRDVALENPHLPARYAEALEVSWGPTDPIDALRHAMERIVEPAEFKMTKVFVPRRAMTALLEHPDCAERNYWLGQTEAYPDMEAL